MLLVQQFIPTKHSDWTGGVPWVPISSKAALEILTLRITPPHRCSVDLRVINQTCVMLSGEVHRARVEVQSPGDNPQGDADDSDQKVESVSTSVATDVVAGCWTTGGLSDNKWETLLFRHSHGLAVTALWIWLHHASKDFCFVFFF